MAIKIQGDKEAIAKLLSISDKKMRRYFEPALLKVSEKIKRHAQKNLRDNGSYDTGALHDSLKAENIKAKKPCVYRARTFADFPDIQGHGGKSNYRGKKHGRYGKRIYYAMHVEFGTKHNKAKPYLMPAGNDPAIYEYGKQLMEQAMERVIK